MEPAKSSSHHQLTTKWYAGDDEDDSWINYLNRNFHHIEGETSPFTDSEWSCHDEDLILHDKALKCLYECPDVDASKIKVLVVRKDIFLTGEVDSEAELKKAEEVVMEIEDVWSVINKLEVRQ